MPPPNDICGKAIQLADGDQLSGHSNADATPSLQFESPAVFEATCIQTIENDVWYKFKATEGVAQYEIDIVSGFCTTPAGLQALLIKADGCSASKFVYRGCSNKVNRDTIKLFLPDPEPGQNYFVWIDGYDGTVCEFEISLHARKNLISTDYRFLRFDYQLGPKPLLPLEDFRASFANNTATLTWSADPSQSADLYIVELLPVLDGVTDPSRYARVVGFVDPHHFVGSGRTNYTFTDYVTPFNQSVVYSYRVIAVDAQGGRLVSPTVSIKSKLVESFDVREVKAGSEEGKFEARYINHKKGQRYQVSVENDQHVQVKHMVLDNEPVRDGTVTIDMTSLPHGAYFFIMSNGRDAFRRAFFW